MVGSVGAAGVQEAVEEVEAGPPPSEPAAAPPRLHQPQRLCQHPGVPAALLPREPGEQRPPCGHSGDVIYKLEDGVRLERMQRCFFFSNLFMPYSFFLKGILQNSVIYFCVSLASSFYQSLRILNGGLNIFQT